MGVGEGVVAPWAAPLQLPRARLAGPALRSPAVNQRAVCIPPFPTHTHINVMCCGGCTTPVTPVNSCAAVDARRPNSVQQRATHVPPALRESGCRGLCCAAAKHPGSPQLPLAAPQRRAPLPRRPARTPGAPAGAAAAPLPQRHARPLQLGEGPCLTAASLLCVASPEGRSGCLRPAVDATSPP